MGRPLMQLTYHLTQTLTGHGSFRSYLYRMGRANDRACAQCHAPEDTAEHTIFDCPHWAEKRDAMQVFLNGRLPTPDDVEDIICGPVGWTEQEARVQDVAKRIRVTFNCMVQSILTEKEADERAAEIAGH